MLTGNYESAADVVQEAFAEALRQRRRFRGEGGSPEAWVWSIATRIALRERARSRREGASGDGLNDDEVAFGDLVQDPAVADALRTLPERRRLITFLHYFADLSYEQIAEICEVTPGTVGATLAQARDALRSALKSTNEVTT